MTKRRLDFGLFFFGCLSSDSASPYETVLAASRQADKRGLTFVSTPERHFHPFGGAFPAPAVLSAALATTTDTVQIRAGSVITPLHDIVRVVEDWSVVDHLSGGRCAISIGSGWSTSDFVLGHGPDRFNSRKKQIVDDIAAIRLLWAHEPTIRTNPVGAEVEFRTYPQPLSPKLPIWLTSGGSDDTFAIAGKLGVNVLTHLERQSSDQLATRIALYRSEREKAGRDPNSGIVTLMQHTRILSGSEDPEPTRQALENYLTASLDLEARAVESGGATSGGSPTNILDGSPKDVSTVMEQAVSRYLDGAALIGPEHECLRRCQILIDAGVDEIACLVDFLPISTDVLANVDKIADLADHLRPEKTETTKTIMTDEFNNLARHVPR